MMKLENKHRAHVFISESDLAPVFSRLISEVTRDRFDLNLEVTTYAEELLGLAKRHTFDLFILFLNNIIFPDSNLPAEHRLRRALSLVVHLKARYRKPVICIYGWPNDPSYGRQAMLAGADFVFQAPCDAEPLRRALKECLEDLATRLAVKQEGGLL